MDHHKEIAYVSDAVATNWYDRANDYLSRFERAFAVATERRFAVSLPSCTSGIHLALSALGVGAGDEVIVPDVVTLALLVGGCSGSVGSSTGSLMSSYERAPR